MGSEKTWTEVKEKNQLLPCTVEGCTRRRAGVSKICQAHMQRLMQFGHPLARPIKLKDIARTWLAESRRLVLKNKNGAGVQAFCDWFRASVQIAVEQPHQIAGARFWAEMTEADPLDVLTIIAGIYLAYYCGRLSQLRDEKSLWYCITNNAIIHWHPSSEKKIGRIGSPERRNTVEYLRRHLLPLCEAFVKAIEEERAARESHYATLSQPLETDNPVKLIELEKQRSAEAERERRRVERERAKADAKRNLEETPPVEAPTGSEERPSSLSNTQRALQESRAGGPQVP